VPAGFNYNINSEIANRFCFNHKDLEDLKEFMFFLEFLEVFAVLSYEAQLRIVDQFGKS
jgi:hypothetical protein